MAEMINDTLNKLTLDEMKLLPIDERSRYYERYIFELITAHERLGLTQKEIEQVTGIASNTVSKYLEMLFSKRNVYRVKRGKNITYFPNGRLIHPLINKDIIVFDGFGAEHRYKAYAVDNPDGKFLYLQEKEIDRKSGMENVVGGVLIPEAGISKFRALFDEFEKSFKKIILEE